MCKSMVLLLCEKEKGVNNMGKIQIEYMSRSIESILPYEKNPRINEAAVPAVMESIKEFGFKIPIVLTTDNVIVAGHTRIKAAKQLGMKEVPCVIADDLSEENQHSAV